MAYLLLKARKKIYHGTSAIFKEYGKSVTDHPGVYCIIGVLLTALAFVGIPLVKVDVSLDTIWMEKDSRFVKEQNTYIDHFGHLPRLGLSAFSQKSGGNILTHQGLESIMDVMKHLYAFDDPDVIKMDTMIDGEMVTMTPDDFCERPILPDILKPTDPTDPLSYVRKGAYQSHGYVEMVKCLHKSNSWLGTLPDGWGIDKAPCMRISVIDCFQEGGIDYPKSLKVLEPIGRQIGIFMQGLASNEIRAKQVKTCLDGIETQMRTDMEILSVPDAAYNAAKERYFLQEFTWQIFISFGYHWRPSLKDFQTEAEVVEHIQKSLEAPFTDPEYGIEKCIMQSVVGETPRCCMVWAGSDIGRELYLGQPILDNKEKGKWTGVKSVRNPVVAQPSDSPLWVKEMKEKFGIDDTAQLEQLIMDWENHTIQYLHSLHQGKNGTGFGSGEKYDGIKVDLHTDRSTADMAVDSAAPETHLLILGAGLMFLYSFIVMGSFSNKCINSNILTIFVGFVVSGLAVVGSTGIMGFVGIETMSLSVIVQLAGFILCIGNVYIMMFTFNSRLDTDKPVEDNMVATIEFGGHVIFVVSATLFLGFLCGVYVPVPGFRSLCIQMAAICLLSFLLQLFMFMPAMVWNCKRTQDNRMDCIPVKRQDGKPPKKSFLTQTKDLFKDYPTIRHSTTKQSLLSKFANSIYGPIILNKVIRLIVLAFFVVFLGSVAYITLELTADGMMMSDVAKPGTYQSSFAQLNEAEYEMFSSYVVTQSKNYANTNNQRKNMEMYESLRKNKWLVEFPIPKAWDWLSDGKTTLTGFSSIMQDIENKVTKASFARKRNNSDTPYIPSEDALFQPDNIASLESDLLLTINASEPLRPSEFRIRMHEWLGSLGSLSLPALSCKNPATNLQASCYDSDNALVATRTAIYMRNLTSHDNIIAGIKAVQDAVDDMSSAGFETFVYGFTFGFWGLYINLRQNLALLCGCILVGIVVPITVFHCSLNAAFLIALCMVAGVFQVFGSFWVLGVNLNGFSLVPLVLGAALVVQHSIFVIHSFIGLVNDRKKRAKKTLAETFPAIFSAVFSLFLLISPLAFTEIPFIRKYICFIFLSVAFSAFNIPLLLLPCILSLMGPRNFDSGCEEGDDSDSEAEIVPAFIPPLASNDFKQTPPNNYTRLTLRSDDGTIGGNNKYEAASAVPDGRTDSPL